MLTRIRVELGRQGLPKKPNDSCYKHVSNAKIGGCLGMENKGLNPSDIDQFLLTSSHGMFWARRWKECENMILKMKGYC